MSTHEREREREREHERASDMQEHADMTPDASYELLGARNVSVNINGVQILREINLKIGVAERVAIVGANGAGKRRSCAR